MSDDSSSTRSQSTDEKNKRSVAVALGYEPGTDRAPRVLAGGHGSVAEQILEIAFANGIKVREDADLSELLSAIDLESEIPTEAFTAVAEILIYVYRANGNWPSFLNDAFGGGAPHSDDGAGSDGIGDTPP